MHGKIVRYLSSNGKGVVINSSKMLFEFTKETWHDKKVIPMVGMYVEFRCDEYQKITSCKASKFQDFKKEYLVTEMDFWKNESDEKLEALQSNKRDYIVQNIYKTTQYDNLQNIPLTLEVVQIIERYFYQEILAITFLNNISLPKEPVLYDYVHFKRFGQKALDSLLYNDKTISKDEFIDELNVIARLESAYNDFEHYSHLNIKNIFEKHFLAQQCHFQALLIAIDKAKNSQNYYLRRIEFLRGQILLLDKRIQNKNEVEKSLAKKERFQEELKSLLQDSTKAATRYSKLEILRRDFEEKYYKIFEVLFWQFYQRIHKRVKEGLDVCITHLDDKIFLKSLHSLAYQKNYFKSLQNDRAPTILYYMEQYLEHLNKERLNEADSLLYCHVEKIKKEHCKYFLIVTSDEKEALWLKLKLLLQSKFYSVKVAYKQIVYFHLLREYQFEKIYIDGQNLWKDIKGIIEDVKSLKNNAKTPLVLISPKDKENRFGFFE